jgi:hypothetical protein
MMIPKHSKVTVPESQRTRADRGQPAEAALIQIAVRSTSSRVVGDTFERLQLSSTSDRNAE